MLLSDTRLSTNQATAAAEPAAAAAAAVVERLNVR